MKILRYFTPLGVVMGAFGLGRNGIHDYFAWTVLVLSLACVYSRINPRD